MADAISQIKDSLALSSYIGRFIEVKQAGAGKYKACCPFHNEKTPSFSIDDQKGFYHCFGCGAHGDVIKFAQEYHLLDFRGVMELFSEELGIELKFKSQEEIDAQNTEISAMQKVLFYTQIQLSKHPEVQKYLTEERKLTDETIKKFRLGYIPRFAKEELVKAVKNLSGDPEELLIKVGVFGKDEKERVYCRFDGRVICPIFNKDNQPVAFGGRVFDIESKAKYINSPETELFKKNQTIFNFNNFSYSSREGFFMEGYFDVIMMSQFGFENVFAAMGTAATEDQMRIILGKVDKLNFIMDSDEAGIRASERIAKLIVKIITPGKTVSFLRPQECKDIDEELKKHGKPAMEKVLANKVDLSILLWQIIAKGKNLQDPNERASVNKKIYEVLKGANEEIYKSYRSYFLDQIWHARRGQGRVFIDKRVKYEHKANIERLIEEIKEFILQNSVQIMANKDILCDLNLESITYIEKSQEIIELEELINSDDFSSLTQIINEKRIKIKDEEVSVLQKTIEIFNLNFERINLDIEKNNLENKGFLENFNMDYFKAIQGESSKVDSRLKKLQEEIKGF